MSEPLLLLAFDTSGPVGSVAVGRGGEVLARGWIGEKAKQASGLVPEIAATLRRAGVDREALRGLVVGRGPGSFTGLRIAAATARGLAKALRIPLWHHSSLAAAAASPAVDLPGSMIDIPAAGSLELSEAARGWPRFVLFDARSDRVYAACYRFLEEKVATLLEPTASTLSSILGAPVPENALFCGDAAVRHSAAITDAGHRVLPLPLGLPTAEGLLLVHRLGLESEPSTDGTRWEPEYLRDSPATPRAKGARQP